VTTPPVTAVIPLKAIADGKTRLAGALSPADRALLLRRTFDRVVAAVAAADLVAGALVVVGDAEGAGWAADVGLAWLPEPAGGGGLNAALDEADRHLGDRPTLVVPADLPLVGSGDVDAVVAALPPGGGVVIAPTSDGGTGALLRSPGRAIAPCYGPGSALAHAAAAAAAGLPCRTLWIPGLALDLDSPGDLDRAGGWSAVTARRTLPD
jgi:2-phospho-L-lactate guanylyltransferase